MWKGFLKVGEGWAKTTAFTQNKKDQQVTTQQNTLHLCKWAAANFIFGKPARNSWRDMEHLSNIHELGIQNAKNTKAIQINCTFSRTKNIYFCHYLFWCYELWFDLSYIQGISIRYSGCYLIISGRLASWLFQRNFTGEFFMNQITKFSISN